MQFVPADSHSVPDPVAGPHPEHGPPIPSDFEACHTELRYASALLVTRYGKPCRFQIRFFKSDSTTVLPVLNRIESAAL